MTSPNPVQPAARADRPQAPPPAAAGAAETGNRLAWLDVLRGLAALCVVFDHFGYFVPSRLNGAVYQWINPGDYGVFVFFLISGYIVPASLERKGSVRNFWVSRIFRLYPLYLLAIALALVLYAIHVGGLRGEGADPQTSVLSQMLMMSNVLAGENLPNVVWSLSYEMIFYLLLTALFMARVHRRSSRYALAFAVAAVALGGLLPQAYFTTNLWSPRIIALVADLVVLTGLAVAVALRGMPRLVGAALAAMVGLALRRIIWPRILTWLGLISYSVYLLHPALIQVYRHLSWTAHHPFWLQVLIDALFVAVLLAVCSATYLFVERPIQDVGRRLARRLDARFGPDRHPVRMRARQPALAHSSGAGE